MILVINPNSNEAVTAAIDRGLAPLRRYAGVEIAVCGLDGTPFGIESEADGQAAVAPLIAMMQAAQAHAYVIACYSDPGLAVAREQLGVPVFGMGQAGLLTAKARADRVGVIALSRGAIVRHYRMARVLGLDTSLLYEEPVDLRVHETVDRDASMAAMLAAGRVLRDRDGAGAIVLGCAGMADMRQELAAALAVPVIDGCQAAVAMALGQIDG